MVFLLVILLLGKYSRLHLKYLTLSILSPKRRGGKDVIVNKTVAGYSAVPGVDKIDL